MPAVHSARSPGTLEILKQRLAWQSFAGLFCLSYVIYFLLSWLPYYLVRERHFSMDSMAKIGGALYLTQALCAVAYGRISDRLISRGKTAAVHKVFVITGLIGTATFLVASSVVGPNLSVVLLMFVGVFFGMCLSNLWPITQILAGSQASGRWTGLQCGFGNLSGAVAAAVTGFIRDHTGHFFWAFAVCAGVCCTGALCWSLMGPIEPVKWSQSTETMEGAA